MEPIVFYDGTCGLCDWVVQFLLKRDKKEIFRFAPLQGKTAKRLLREEERQIDSLVLVSEGEHFLEAKGALRIAWLLGGFWSVLGLLSFLPGCFFNWAYRLVARNRHYFFKNISCQIPQDKFKDRFFI